MIYNNSGIQFSNVQKVSIPIGGLGGYESYNITAAQAKNANFELTDDKIPGKVINTIDIDWNGAEITSTAFPAMDRTINTTGDLLSWIKNGIEEAAKTGGSIEPVEKTCFWYIGGDKLNNIDTSNIVTSGLGWRRYKGTDGIVYDGTKLTFDPGYYYLVIPSDVKVVLPNGENYLLAFDEVGFENNIDGYKQYISKNRIASFSGIIKI